MAVDYPNLEPHHAVHELSHNDVPLRIVVCPFTDPATGQHFETPWSAEASPDEVTCLFCEWLNGELHLAGAPHGGEPT